MAEWEAFVGLSTIVCLLLLGLSRATSAALTEPPPPAGNGPADPVRTDADPDGRTADPYGRVDDPDARGGVDAASRNVRGPRIGEGGSTDRDRPADESTDSPPRLSDRNDVPSGGRPNARDPPPGGPTRLAGEQSTGTLLANVALSQGLFAAVLLGGAVYAEIPADALGIAFSRSYVVAGIVVGTAVGAALYLANEFGALAAKRVGIDHDEELRETLAPASGGGWVVLLVLVLPLVAFFEEFLFRAALVGAAAAGLGVSPWALAVVSSVAFALGHGVQGPTGIAVTGLLGFALAAAFVATGSLLVVVVAHYLINALEFAIHEGLGLEWDVDERGGDAPGGSGD